MVVAQMRPQASFRTRIPELMLHLDPEPQHIGRLALHCRYFTEPLKVMSRLPVVLLLVIHAHQARVRHCHVRCDAYGAQQVRARTRVIVQGQALPSAFSGDTYAASASAASKYASDCAARPVWHKNRP